MHQTHFCKKGEEKRGHAARALFFVPLTPPASLRRAVLFCRVPLRRLPPAPTLAAVGNKILHGFYKTDTLDLTLTCYDGISQKCVKYENE